MDRVNIQIMSTAKGPAKQEALGMYIVEVIRNGIPETKQGFLYREKITANELILQLFVNAVFIANKQIDEYDTMECYIDSPLICSAFSNKWLDKWQENEWLNVKGKPVANAETWKLLCEQIEKSTKRLIVKDIEESTYRNLMRHSLKRELEKKKAIQEMDKKIYGGGQNADVQ